MEGQPPYIYGETFSREAPRLTPEIYSIISRYLAQEGEEKNLTHETLNDVYKALNSTEQEADTALDQLEQSGRITREESLVILVVLMASKTLGPNLDFLRQAITAGDLKNQALNEQLLQSGLDNTIIEYVKGIIDRS